MCLITELELLQVYGVFRLFRMFVYLDQVFMNWNLYPGMIYP